MILRNIIVFLFAVFCLNATASINSDIEKSFDPLSTGKKEGNQWVNLEVSMLVPTNLEDHLLLEYIRSWDNGDLPSSYGVLKSQLTSNFPERVGYPLVGARGVINRKSAGYWINHHIKHLPSNLRSSRATYYIDSNKTELDEDSGLLKIVYVLRLEVEPDHSILKGGKVQTPDNLHDSYLEILGVKGDLLNKALTQLRNKKLPTPRLVWRDKVNNVKHSCLGDRVQSGVLSFGKFSSNYKPLQNKCYLSTATSEAVAKPLKRSVEQVTVYPEYQELFRDKKLSVLIAVNQCKEESSNYYCSEDGLETLAELNALATDLADMGYTKTEQKENVSYFTRKDGELTIELAVLRQKRPVLYEDKFWELYPNYELILSNRVPMMSNHFNKSFAPKYQIVMADYVRSLAWGRILPHLDYKMYNFDAIDASLNQLGRKKVMGLVESIAGVYADYKKPLSDWSSKDLHWEQILADLERDPSGESNVRATAHFVRHNSYNPSKKRQKAIRFTAKVDANDYVRLLNTESTDRYNSNIDYRLSYLYLTLYKGDEAANFDQLREGLKAICEQDISNDRVKRNYFFKNCTPRSLLASENTVIHGTNFARGSYIRLYRGNAGKPNQVYLSENTQIGDFVFKAYFQDTAGVVKFYQKEGTVEHGHLGEHLDYKGLPLLGGRGTSRIDFYADGQIQNARIRQSVDYSINLLDNEGKVKGQQKLRLRGGSYAPHKVTFHPNGQLNCAYLDGEQQVGDLMIAGVETDLGVPVESKEERKVCFHANGQLAQGIVAQPFSRKGVEYPLATQLVIDFEGELTSPIYKEIKKNQSFWGAVFPEGSLYTTNAKGKPTWIRLEGELTLRKKHWMPKGTEITFNSNGYFTKIKAPESGDKEPTVKLEAYTLKVPFNSTLIFSRWGDSTPERLLFKDPIEINGLTFAPPAEGDGYRRSLRFHDSGRIARGVLANDVEYDDDHYGTIPLKGGEVVELNERGGVEQATLSRDYSFVYTILEEDEIPNEGTYYEGAEGELYLAEVNVPSGSLVNFRYDGKISGIDLKGKFETEKYVIEEGASFSLNSAHEVESINFSENGGKVGDFFVGQGRVRFHDNDVPESLTLAKAATVEGLDIPAGASLSFYSSGKLEQISASEATGLAISYDGREYTREITFYSNGKVKEGYLAADAQYGDVMVAGLATCQALRQDSSNRRRGGSTCMVTFYEDGKSFLSGIAAESLKVGDKQITAGQPIEFLEDGSLYLE